MGNHICGSKKDSFDNQNVEEISNLEEGNWKSLPLYLPIFTRCRPVSIHDGDTFWVTTTIDGMKYRINVRLYGYDAWELKSAGQKGLRAKEALERLIKDKEIHVKTHNYDCFGRLLITVYNEKEEDIVPILIQEGHGYPYEKKGKMKHGNR